LVAGAAAAGNQSGRVWEAQVRYIGPEGHRATSGAGCAGEAEHLVVGRGVGWNLQSTDGGIHWGAILTRRSGGDWLLAGRERSATLCGWNGNPGFFLRSQFGWAGDLQIARAGKTWSLMDWRRRGESGGGD